MRLPFVLLVAVTPAFAQPKPGAPANKVPMRSVPCAMDDLKLFASGIDAVVCWDKGCMKLDMYQSDATWIVKPAAPKPWMIPVAEVKDTEVCLGTKCKPLGKKLLAAIADYKKNHDPATPFDIRATTDLKAVLFGDFGNDQFWSVAGDKKITLAPPPTKGNVVGHEVVGDLVVVQWSACAGPCTQYTITDSAGRSKGPTGAGGGGVFQLDAKRFVVMSEYSQINVFDLGTAKARGSIDLQGEPEQVQAVRIDDESIFVMYRKKEGRQVVKVSLPNDKTKPRADESMYLPRCNP